MRTSSGQFGDEPIGSGVGVTAGERCKPLLWQTGCPSENQTVYNVALQGCRGLNGRFAYMPPPHTALNRTIRTARQARGMTQERLAEAIGVDLKTVQRWERGAITTPHPDSLRRLSSVLGIDEADLFRLASCGHDPDEADPAREPTPRRTRLQMGAPSEPTSRFVGRERELERFLGLIGEADRGHGHLAMISGDAGIGKTRLAVEFASAAHEEGMSVLWGRCYEGEALPAFWPWVEVLTEAVAQSSTDTLRYALGLGAAYVAQIVPSLREILNDIREPQLLDPSSARFQLYEAVSRLLIQMGEDNAIFLVLEDLHWADTASLRLLAFLARRLANSRIVILGTTRPSAPAPDSDLYQTLTSLGRETALLRIPLGGLTNTSVSVIVADILGLEPPPDIVDALTHRTGGNPFFLIELLHLIERHDRTDPAALNRLLEASVPDAVQEVIRQRLARLSQDSLELLTVAAVAGVAAGDFPLEVVADCLSIPFARALDLAEEPVQAGLVSVSQGLSTRLRFSQDLVRETLYAGINALRRARLHLKLAEALESCAPGDDPTFPVFEVAYHYLHAVPAGGLEKAVGYAIRAADRSVLGLAFEQAERHLHTAVELVHNGSWGPERLRQELALQARLSHLLAQTRGYASNAVAEAASRAWELAKRLNDPKEFSSAWRIGIAQLVRADYQQAEAFGAKLLESRDVTTDVGLWAGHLVVGIVMTNTGRLREANSHLGDAVTIAESFRISETTRLDAFVHHPLVTAKGQAAQVAWLLGDDARCTRLLIDSLAFALELDHPSTLAFALFWASVGAMFLRDPELSLRRAGEAVTLCQERGFAHLGAESRILRGWALVRLQSFDEGLNEIQEGLRAYQGTGARIALDAFFGLQAEACLSAGRLDEGLEAVERGFAENTEVGTMFWLPELFRVKAELLSAMSRSGLEDAVREVERAIDLATGLEAHAFRLRATATLRKVKRLGKTII
jgi:transcriptional regulator with XRE-family HTH domain/predicted ATPase